jgi:hypothetical protein
VAPDRIDGFRANQAMTPKPGEHNVRGNWPTPTRRLTTPIACLSLSVASDVQEIPEASKKTLIKRKVDVEQRPAKSSKAGKASSKGRPGNP